MSRFSPVPTHAAERMRATPAGGFRVVESRNFIAVPLHAHADATLTFVLDGELEESYRGRRAERCPARSVLWRPPGLVHADRFAPAGAYTAVVEVAAARWDGLPERERVFAELAHRRGGEWDVLLARLRQELGRADSVRVLALEALALEALATLARHRERERAAAPPWLATVLEVLHQRFAAPDLRIAALAAAAGVHPVHLARVFRARLGCSPAAYVRRLRLEAAARALGTTRASIAEVALAAGFADQSHLTRAFRRAYGLPPAAYRRRAS